MGEPVMFVSLLELALGAITIGLCFGWIILDNRWLSRRIDDLDDAHDRDTRATSDQLQRAEDWIKHLDERTRRQAGALPPEPARFVVSGNTVTDTDPGQVPAVDFDPATFTIEIPANPSKRTIAKIPVAPPTVPDGMPLAVQAALIERPRAQDWVEAELERIRASTAQRTAQTNKEAS